MPVDFYNVLEVSPAATEEVIHAAYRALAKANVGNDAVINRLNGAKDILLDPKRRQKYDDSRNNVKGKVIGNYKVVEEIAEGGFGKTYKGEQITLGTPVCIKHAHMISPQDEEILLEEAKAIWDLRHYGIPTMRDLVRLEDGSLVLIMSYVPGPTLAQIIEKHKRGIDPEHVSWIAERVLNILKYLHFHGVVHGDVKPQNIILQPETHQVTLVDYGLSLIRPSKNTSNKGYTPHFASPEQERGGVLLPESDFYSLAVTMIYALGGNIETKKVPSTTPEPICDFIKRLLPFEVLSRPSWDKEDLMESFQHTRAQAFGRRYSNMKPWSYS